METSAPESTPEAPVNMSVSSTQPRSPTLSHEVVTIVSVRTGLVAKWREKRN